MVAASPFRLALACALSLAGLTSHGAAQQPSVPVIKPVAGPYAGSGTFNFRKRTKKTRRSVSGIACPKFGRSGPPPSFNCLLAFDEGTEAREVVLTPRRRAGFKMDARPIELTPDHGELDAEAAANDGRFYYVTGSHSAKRKSCKSNPESRYVIRLALDPATGAVLRGKHGDIADKAVSARLWPILKTLPEIRQHVGKEMCLGTEPPAKGRGHVGRNGINIEGMAVANNRLHFGLRGPAKAGAAFIVSVANADLFGAAPTQPAEMVTRLPVGAGRAIRDMVATDGGVLLLIGPDDTPSNKRQPYQVGLWDGVEGAAASFKQLAQLDLSSISLRGCDKEVKPEAIAVLAATTRQYEVVILADGLCDGGPMLFDVPR